MGSMGWGNQLRFDFIKGAFLCVLSNVCVVTNLNLLSNPSL